MEAVCRGASEAGGETLGILPGSSRDDCNPWVGIPVVTGMGSSRNRIVALTGRAMIAVGGKYGTLSEIAFALDAGRPVCVIGRWDGIEGVVSVSGPEDALEFIMSRTGESDAQHRGT